MPLNYEVIESFANQRGISPVTTGVGFNGWSAFNTNGTSGINCPSGYGYAIQATVGAFFIRRPIASPRTSMGYASYHTMNLSADATYRLVYRSVVSGTPRGTYLHYRQSTNTFRIAYNENFSTISIVEFSAPADPTQPFHLAFEVIRDNFNGSVKVWLNGTQIVNLVNVNTGSSADAQNVHEVYLPQSTSGSCTRSNLILWDPTLGAWDGRIKIIDHLFPAYDVAFANMLGTSAQPYYADLAQVTGTTSWLNTTGAFLRVGFGNLTVEPEEIFGIELYWKNAVISTNDIAVHEPSYNHTFTTTTGGASVFHRHKINGPNAGGNWTTAQLNALEASWTRVTSSIQIPFAHILVVRTAAVSSLTPTVGTLTISDQSDGRSINSFVVVVGSVSRTDAGDLVVANSGTGASGDLEHIDVTDGLTVQGNLNLLGVIQTLTAADGFGASGVSFVVGVLEDPDDDDQIAAELAVAIALESALADAADQTTSAAVNMIGASVQDEDVLGTFASTANAIVGAVFARPDGLDAMLSAITSSIAGAGPTIDLNDEGLIEGVLAIIGGGDTVDEDDAPFIDVVLAIVSEMGFSDVLDQAVAAGIVFQLEAFPNRTVYPKRIARIVYRLLALRLAKVALETLVERRIERDPAKRLVVRLREDRKVAATPRARDNIVMQR